MLCFTGSFQSQLLPNSENLHTKIQPVCFHAIIFIEVHVYTYICVCMYTYLCMHIYIHKYFTTDNFPRKIRYMREVIWEKKASSKYCNHVKDADPERNLY